MFFRITALKQAGFSLSEIKGMIERVDNDAEIIELFDQKEAEIIEMLHNLKSAKKMMIGANVMIHVVFNETEKGWTKGFVLRKWNSCACAYEIRTVDDRDYLIIEWKSGDYRWGGFDTDYYVFVRA
ncbi:MAG: hypothetical protein IJO85_06860 [Lachnospiraceae bacterium]|nr:hypothetical protein [Lachnospiraceae bacterium]